MRALLITSLILTLSCLTAQAAPVLLTESGICHCPGGQYYKGIKRGQEFSDLASCLATGAREPKRGQGDCGGAAVSQTPREDTAPAATAHQLTQGYDRHLYGDGWNDENADCRDTRAEVLISQSVAPVRMRKNGCSVSAGRWNDPYTGKVFTDAADLDIDHLVPLAWAHAHGADRWTADKRLDFANWAPNLFPVDASVNRQKGADGPLTWLPPRTEYRCEYVVRFERVVLTWGLEFTKAERAGLDDIKAHWCPAG